MSNTLTKTEITQLPIYTSRLRELQWRVENWQRAHAEAGLQKSIAWEKYAEAIENEEPHEVIEQLFCAATMFEAICVETWREWEKSKARLLALLN